MKDIYAPDPLGVLAAGRAVPTARLPLTPGGWRVSVPDRNDPHSPS